jgi:protein CpxP
MVNVLKTRLSTVLVAGSLALAGCGQVVPYSSVPNSAAPASSAAYSALAGDPTGNAPSATPEREVQGLFGPLNLTTEQKQQLKAIAQKHRQEAKKGDHMAQIAQLKSLVLADTVDQAALMAFLSSHLADAQARIATRVDMLAGMRAVLTDDQRKALVDHLNQAGGDARRAKFAKMGDQMAARLTQKLNLTADQKVAFDALRAKIKDLIAGKRETMKQAFSAFVQTGDKAALTAALSSATAKPPIDDVVAFVASLSHDQRQTAVDLIGHLAQGMHRMHGHFFHHQG